MQETLNFYRGKKVFITGHTGFKGAWMCKVLQNAGAEIVGYALEPPTDPSLFTILRLQNKVHSMIGDIRERTVLEKCFKQYQPEIVIHMAAQPLVRTSYEQPAYTYETNVMGTVNVLECIRNMDCVKSFVNVTTDKVYQNKEWCWGYRETDRLNGYDPYSNSKSCSELVTDSYRRSFLQDKGVAVSTARAGNVIGGGDFAKDRIIPDCVRAAKQKQDIQVRNPYSVRPYQHVLEPIFAYLMIAQKQYENVELAGSYNIGPNEQDCITTGQIVDLFCDKWQDAMNWFNESELGPHEANFLKLDCSKARDVFGWHPIWNIEQAVEKTVEWSKTYLVGGNVEETMDRQIREYYTSFKES